MSEKIDTNLAHLNKVLESVTDSLSSITQIRDEQNKSISELSRTIDSKTVTLTEKYNKLENKIRRNENDTLEDVNKLRSQNKTVTGGLDKRITSLELQIKLMEESLQQLRVQQEANIKTIEELRPKVGKKRKWWQVI